MKILVFILICWSTALSAQNEAVNKAGEKVDDAAGMFCYKRQEYLKAKTKKKHNPRKITIQKLGKPKPSKTEVKILCELKSVNCS